jgi:2-keto-4-pentenoate hydratase
MTGTDRRVLGPVALLALVIAVTAPAAAPAQPAQSPGRGLQVAAGGSGALTEGDPLLGVDQPDYGHLFADTQASGEIAIDTLLQPRAEGEIAFVLGRDLVVDGEISVGDVLAATEYVCPSLEIVDSRVRDWRIGIVDTVADNASCGAYVLGNERTPVRDFDRLAERMNLYVNGELRGTGTGTAVLGNSAYCVAWLAEKMRGLGTLLRVGDVILPGALCKMVPVAQGDRVTAEFSTIGTASVVFV